MDVRIGVTYTAKEIDIDLGDEADTDAIASMVEQALDQSGVLWLSDKNGRRIGIPSEKLAYVDIGSPDSDRRIGFGA